MSSARQNVSDPKQIKAWWPFDLPSGKLTKNYGKSPSLMGKSTISMAIFNSYVSLPEGSSVLLWDTQRFQCDTQRFQTFRRILCGFKDFNVKKLPGSICWFQTFFIFHFIYGNFIIPTDFHSIIFQRGRAQPPTRFPWLSPGGWSAMDFTCTSRQWHMRFILPSNDS